ncbi:hypothetical protein JCM10213_002150 [Rhodosporidiobolus nylandii]
MHPSSSSSSASPRPSHAALRPPPSRNESGSQPSSPHISPTSSAPFSFPQSSASTIPAPPLTASSSRFNAAFAAYPSASRHAGQASVSSVTSDSSLRFLAHGSGDLPSPGEERAFDALQRELGGAPVDGRGLGFEGVGLGYPREMGRLYEEPEEYDTLRGLPNGGLQGGGRDADDAPPAPVRRIGSATRLAGMGENGEGRPPSMNLDTVGPSERNMAFLLSPPPSFDPPTSASAKQFAAAASDAPKQQRAGERQGTGTVRERIFPAPLLLKGDRSYSFSSGGSGVNGVSGHGGGAGTDPASPVLGFPPTAPLSIPRRPSATASPLSTSIGAASGSPGPSYQRRWEREREREGPMNPPESTTRSHLPYHSHRRQQSSIFSLSHGSYLPYSNSYSYEPRHQPSASTSTAASATASPAVGTGRNAHAFPTPPPSSTPLPSVSAPQHAPSASAASSSGAISTTTVTPSSASTEPPITAQALLLHVLALRSAASSPMGLSQSQGPLSRTAGLGAGGGAHQRIRSASSAASGHEEPSGAAGDPRARSAGGAAQVRLDTVDLSHKRIADVPPEVVDELRDEVEKLALGYNLLKELPAHLSGLGSRLKYLNVRVNMMTAFPAVLCEMPSLEILDISRNKIRKLPAQPGTLLNLKVFSIAKNRIKRLPVWFTSMSHLKVLKLDHNPLEWPPREVATFPLGGSIGGMVQPMTKQEEADEMQKWLPALMRWMKENRASEVERERVREGEKRRRPSVAVEHISEDEGPVPDRRLGGTSRTDSGRITESVPRSRTTQALPSVDLDAVAEDPSTSVSSSSAALDPSVRHSRGASHSTTQTLAPSPRPALRAKKSLPDLRQSHADILAERRTGTSLEEAPPQPVVSALDGTLKKVAEEGKHPGHSHSTSARAALPTQASAAPSPSPSPPAPKNIVRSQSSRPVPSTSPPVPPPQPRQGTAPLPHTAAHRPKMNLDAPLRSTRGELDHPSAGAAGVGSGNEFDRNSGAYFRRLSMLPVSTIAKTIPAPLLSFADAIRGILFSLSQIYSALRQFVVFASQDRLPGPVARLMGSADVSMAGLINALDRFDSLSRRGTPSTNIVRDVFSECRVNVAVFGRLVAALQPQLKALTATADARYTRTLLLMLYGSMGEIANSWAAVAPLFPSPSPDPSSIAGAASLVVQPPTPSPRLEQSTPPPPDATLSSSTSGARLTRQRSTTRRHAGSFSVEDVQLGAVLPPADVPPVPALPFAMEDGGLSASTPGLAPVESPAFRARPPLSAKSSASSAGSFSGPEGGRGGRAAPPGALAMPPQLGYEEMAQKAFEHPITPGVQGFIERTTGSSGSNDFSRLSSRAGSFSAPQNAPPAPYPFASAAPSYTAAPPPPQAFNYTRAHRESRPVSTLNADETFLDQAESTMAIAADVYGMLLDSFEDPSVALNFGSISNGRKKLRELGELCRAGTEVTGRLRRGVDRVRGSDGRGRLKFAMEDAMELGTAAFEYVQNVIRTAKLMKSVSQELAFPQHVKDAVGQLTLGTKEFARLLSHGHTSFRPSHHSNSGVSPGPPHSGSNSSLSAVAEGYVVPSAGPPPAGALGGRSRAGTINAFAAAPAFAGGVLPLEGPLPEVRARDFAAQ